MAENRFSEKETFEKISAARLATIRRIMLFVFCGLGIVFAILGLILNVCGIKDASTGVRPGDVFLPLGIVFAALGGLCYYFIPQHYSYEKYIARRKKGCVTDSVDILIELELMRAQIEALKDEIADLKEQISSTK